MPRKSRSRLALPLLAAALAVAPAGCGYSFRPPYSAKIRTIYVPMFKSTQYRQDLNIQLYEMLVEEINLRSPYRVVSDPDKADARLEGTIVFNEKNAMVENPQNLPRHLLATLTVNVTFTDNRKAARTTRTFPSASVNESAPFYGEIGESATAGYRKVLDMIVRDIVNMMEEPWGDEYSSRDEFRARQEAGDAEYDRFRDPDEDEEGR